MDRVFPGDDVFEGAAAGFRAGFFGFRGHGGRGVSWRVGGGGGGWSVLMVVVDVGGWRFGAWGFLCVWDAENFDGGWWWAVGLGWWWFTYPAAVGCCCRITYLSRELDQ